MQQQLVSQVRTAALCINAATADLTFNNRERLNMLNLNWRKSRAVSRPNIRWNHREPELVFMKTDVDFWSRRDRKLLIWKIFSENDCVEINFLLWYCRGTLSGHQRTAGSVDQTRQQTDLVQNQKRFLLFLSLKCLVPPYSVIYTRRNGHLFFLTPHKCHRLMIFMSAAQVFSMKDCTATQGARRTCCWLLSSVGDGGGASDSKLQLSITSLFSLSGCSSSTVRNDECTLKCFHLERRKDSADME